MLELSNWLHLGEALLIFCLWLSNYIKFIESFFVLKNRILYTYLIQYLNLKYKNYIYNNNIIYFEDNSQANIYFDI